MLALFFALGRFLNVFWVLLLLFFDLLSILNGFLKDLGRVLRVSWEGFGRVLGRLGRDFRAFWAILDYSRLFWVIGLFLAALRKIFAGAVCCLLLLSWSLNSKSVLAFACFCLLLGPAFARF